MALSKPPQVYEWMKNHTKLPEEPGEVMVFEEDGKQFRATVEKRGFEKGMLVPSRWGRIVTVTEVPGIDGEEEWLNCWVRQGENLWWEIRYVSHGIFTWEENEWVCHGEELELGTWRQGEEDGWWSWKKRNWRDSAAFEEVASEAASDPESIDFPDSDLEYSDPGEVGSDQNI